ncbi:MAG: signal peptidase I [Ruminococcus sp.]|nr:signal peptidase I [Ruminococcus sp.]
MGTVGMKGNLSEEEKNKEEKVKEKFSMKKFLNDVADMFESIIFSIFIVLLIFTYLLRISDVSGPSMEPTLQDKDRVVISPLCYEPKQNDIIIVDSSALGKLIVKRVIAVGGQTVDIDFESGIVYVDGEQVDEQLYVKNEDGSEPELKADHFVNTLTTENMQAFENYPIEVPEGSVFVLGDNRNRSKDSKHSELGFVPEEEVVGKVIMRIYPLSDFGFLN